MVSLLPATRECSSYLPTIHLLLYKALSQETTTEVMQNTQRHMLKHSLEISLNDDKVIYSVHLEIEEITKYICILQS